MLQKKRQYIFDEKAKNVSTKIILT